MVNKQCNDMYRRKGFNKFERNDFGAVNDIVFAWAEAAVGREKTYYSMEHRES